LSVYCIDTLVASRADFHDSSAKPSQVAFIHMKRVSSLTTDYLLFIPFFFFFFHCLLFSFLIWSVYII
jgi:hypothetical protein